MRCLGLPPHSCRAFVGDGGQSYRLSVSDPNKCDKCPPDDQLFSVWFFFIALTILGISAIVLYIVFVMKFPQALRRWGSTLTIIVGHVQVLTIIGDLRLELPQSLRYVIQFFDVFSLPDATCLFVEQDIGALSPFWMYATLSCGELLALLLALPMIRCCFEALNRPVVADGTEFTLSIILCVQLTSAWRVAVSVMTGYQAGAYLRVRGCTRKTSE